MAERHHYSVLPRDESRVGKKLSMAGRHHYSVLPRGESRVGEERSTAGRQWTETTIRSLRWSAQPVTPHTTSGLGLRLGSGSHRCSDHCSVVFVRDGKSYFPSLHVTVSLDPALPRCIVAVAIHCLVDLCSRHSRCCSSRLLILVSSRLNTTSRRCWSWSCISGLAYITAHNATIDDMIICR